MNGKTSSSLIEQLIGELFEILIDRADGPIIAPRMQLHPQPNQKSYFMDSTRPRMRRADMERIERKGLFAELESLLIDIPPGERQIVLGKIRTIQDALAQENQEEKSAEPSTLIYAMY